jgi:hypothetical protein
MLFPDPRRQPRVAHLPTAQHLAFAPSADAACEILPQVGPCIALLPQVGEVAARCRVAARRMNAVVSVEGFEAAFGEEQASLAIKLNWPRL